MNKEVIVRQYHVQPTMRGYFAYSLYNAMIDNPKIILIIGDLGFGLFTEIRRDFPERVINTGAAEQAMMGIAVGLALIGMIPVVYSITPFLLFRAAETIRNYIAHENIPVILVGSGRNKDYAHDGFSHYAGDDNDILSLWPNIFHSVPKQKEDIPFVMKEILRSKKPYYLSLTR